MHKNRKRIYAPSISEELSDDYIKDLGGIAQVIVNAVAQYNETLPLSGNFQGKVVDERLIKEAEEQSTKLFLDGILDIVQMENTKSDFFK